MFHNANMSHCNGLLVYAVADAESEPFAVVTSDRDLLDLLDLGSALWVLVNVKVCKKPKMP